MVSIETVLRVNGVLLDPKSAEDAAVDRIGEFIDGMNKTMITVTNPGTNKKESRALSLGYWQSVTLVYGILQNAPELIELLSTYREIKQARIAIENDEDREGA